MKTSLNKKTKKKEAQSQKGKKGGKTTAISSSEEYLEAYYLGKPIDDLKRENN